MEELTSITLIQNIIVLNDYNNIVVKPKYVRHCLSNSAYSGNLKTKERLLFVFYKTC